MFFMTNPTLAITAVFADGVLSHEDTMNLILITIPTILLAVVTVWANDRLFQIAKLAITKLGSSKKKANLRVRGEKVDLEMWESELGMPDD